MQTFLVNRVLAQHIWTCILSCILAQSTIPTTQQADSSNGQGCVRVETALSGKIATPNYPNRYPSLATCKWTLSAPPGSIIQLSFDDFLIEDSFSCSNDYMLLFDGPDASSRKVGRYCGINFPKLFTSSTNYIHIQFNSDVSLTYRGFQATYTTILPTTTKPTIWRSHPKFLETPLNQTVVEEDTLQLTCRVQGSPEPTITWTKELKNLTNYEHAFIENSPFKSVIKIKKVDIKDQGVYSCDAYNGVGSTIMSNSWVTVKQRVLPLIRTTTKNKTVHLGVQLNLICNGSGKPPMEIRLIEGTQNLAKSICQTKACNITLHKTFWKNTFVKCQIANKAGNTTKLVLIKVKGPPIITSAPKDQNVLVGTIANFSCAAVGVPSAEISWLKNNETSFTGVTSLDSRSTFQFTATENATVTCIAKDKDGDTSKYAKLIVQDVEIKYRPTTRRIPITFIEIPKDLTVELGENATVKCLAKGYPEPKISWFQNGVNITAKAIITNGISTLRLKSRESKKVKITCVAKNDYEHTWSAAQITFFSETSVQNKRDDGLSNNTKVVIGVVLGLVFVIGLVVVVVYRRKSKNNAQPRNPHEHDEATENLVLTAPCSKSIEGSSKQGIETLDIQRENIVHFQDLDKGNDVHMYLGRATNLPFTKPGDYKVVVRVLKDISPSEERIDEFAMEASLLVNLVHPNVVRLMAVCIQTYPLCMVFECSECGLLDQYLRDANTGSKRSEQETLPKLDNVDRISIAKQIAAGMQYLVGKNYIHQELRACNCMVFKNLQVKIANLGLRWVTAERNYFDMEPDEKQHFPIRWLSPEVIMYGSYSTSADVWSYGVVVWEIFSHGQQPYSGLDDNDVVTFVRGRNVLPRPKICPPEIYDVVRSCWEVTPLERPSFSSLYQSMSSFHEIVPEVKI